MEEDKRAGYYAIIPATVRYDRRICANAKLLYGEITALCNKEGRCWASNKYFADLYGVSAQSISSWVKQLLENGYITSEVVYKEGTKEILRRYIKIIVYPTLENLGTPPLENFKDNNTSNNNTYNNTNNNNIPPKHKYGTYSHILLTDEEKEKLVAEYGEEFTQDCITLLDEAIEMKGYKYKSHYLAIKKWVVNEVKKKQQPRNNFARSSQPVRQEIIPEWCRQSVEQYQTDNEAERQALLEQIKAKKAAI